MTIIQLALAAFRVLNWLLKRIDQNEWKRQGKLEELNAQRKEYDATMANADQAIATANSSSQEDRLKRLEDDL